MRIFILAFLLLINNNLFSHEKDTLLKRKNAVYVEFLGSSFGVYNLSYDRILTNFKRNNLSVALGCQYFDGFSFTPQINYIYGSKQHHLEVGIGFAVFYYTPYYVRVLEYDRYYDYSSIPIRIGYRYQSSKNGLFFKAAYTPFWSDWALFSHTPFKYTFWPLWGGVCIGYSF